MRATIGTKLLGGFIFLVFVSMALGGISIFQMERINRCTTDLADDWLVSVQQLGAIATANTDIERLISQYVQENDPSKFGRLDRDLREAQQTFRKNLEGYGATLNSPRETELFTQVKDLFGPYMAAVETAAGYARKDQDALALAADHAQVQPRFDQLRKPLDDLMQLNLQGSSEAKRQAADTFRGALLTTLVLLSLSLGVSLVVGLLLSRGITRNVRAIARAAEGIARGDLDQDVAVRSRDELGDMARSFEHMMGNLRQIVGEVRGTASAVAAVSEQISSGTKDLSNLAQHQATSADETASTMVEMAESVRKVAGHAGSLASNVDETSSSIAEMAASVTQVAANANSLTAAVSVTSASINEMAASISQVAENSQQANRSANLAAQAAQSGSHAVDLTIDGMRGINQAMTEVVEVITRLGHNSEQIGTIVEVIDDIAEQTNLLALNAAIEAARAGEHGRGFAVVADEVRKLAERSGKATQEIAQLIKGIQQETRQAIVSTQHGDAAIQEGTRLAHEAGTALGEIVVAVAQASTLMDQIGQATQEQAQASAQITQAVHEMSALTDQVTYAAREQAAGSETIVRAVEVMNRMTSEVSQATQEQQKGSDMAAKAAETISQGAQAAAVTTDQLAQTARDLEQQAHGLMETIAFFKDGRDTGDRKLAPLSDPQPRFLPAVTVVRAS